MKINIAGIRGIPANHGGFETFAESLSLYLHDKNWDVTVYCQTAGWGTLFIDNWNGIRRVNIPIPFGGSISTIIFDLFSTLHICLFSRSLTMVLGYNTAIFSIFYRLSGITSVMNMDGIEWQRSKWGRIAKFWFIINEWLGCKFSNYLIADHAEIKNHLINRHRNLHIHTIPYGAPTISNASITYLHLYNLESNGYYLVIARPEPENSILEIVSSFVQSQSSKKLVILGNYTRNNAYQSKVLNAANDNVMFVGAIYDNMVVQALRFYCFSYIHGHTVGGTNPSLIEAMGAGCPIIAHDNRFNRGVCENSAFYFRSGDDLKNIISNTTDASIQKNKEKLKVQFEKIYTLESIHKQYLELLTMFENHSTQ